METSHLRTGRALRVVPVLVPILGAVLAAAPSTGCSKQAPDRVPLHDEGSAEGVASTANAVGPSSSSSSRLANASAPATAASASARADGGSAASASVDAGAHVDAAATERPPPRVKLVTIGMHVGGGPYDEATKQPMKRSVEARFADLARCWTHVAKKQSTDVGVDLVIEAAGGRANVSHPRTTAAGDAFVPCVVAFFEGVDFERPLGGKTVVSYSVRFSPR